ncbi:MAG: Uncharacterized protein XD76_1576 [candidate division TA06 bacterium 32_111]|jgi:hypothetical protein|nr:MAG: Uncharacterized protein XD76_1576 [candidate division TA06 bacterium 32_111]
MTDSNHWQVIAANDFKRPFAPTVTRVQQRWQRFLRLFGIRENEPEEENNDDVEMPDTMEFDRKPAVDALNHHFEEWIGGKETVVSFLIDPPFSGTDDIARDWAKQQKWKLITPPDILEIRAVDIDDWWKKQTVKNRWLIDDLTRYLLRTTDGLSFIRTLLPQMLNGEFGQGLVVCDSWMFAFIQRIWPFRFSRVYCFAAAGPELLQQVGIHATEYSLRKLAARVRGNVGVALAVWPIEQDKDRKLPELPGEANDVTAFVLYSILLHRGLSGNLLHEVLPMVPSDDLNLQLLQLEQYGILRCNESQWQINIDAYLAVRDFLSGRDFRLDVF